ncbi:MAG: hypothetical protein CMG64_06840 [Candidatus Marinimicrobia bacterium]|nr:hypothetical protein [Candidatus Neomarinimicrobiota bacterium]
MGLSPKISIIIPVYNSPYLEECIKSCYGQSIGSNLIEIIIVNDASNNETKNKLIELENRYDLKIIHLAQNSGPANARNIGMQSAKGNYITFLDSDDMMKSDKLEKQFEFLSNNTDIDIVISGIDEIDQNGNFIRTLTRKFSDNKHKQIEIIFLDNLHTITSTLLFKKNLLANSGYMNPQLLNLEDMDFVIKLLNVGNMHYMPEGLTIRRVLQSGLSNTVSESIFLDSRNTFFHNTIAMFPFLNNIANEYWALNYSRFGRILQKRGLGNQARKFHWKSINYKLNFIGLMGFILSFFPNQFQKYIANKNWRKK